MALRDPDFIGHTAWPLQLDPNGDGFLEHDQDTAEEIMSAVGVALAFGRGTRHARPAFGRPDWAVLRDGHPIPEEVVAAVAGSEDRAEIVLDDDQLTEAAVRALRFGVSPNPTEGT